MCKNPKISYIFKKALFLSIIYNKSGNEDGKIFKEEESIEILKIWLWFNYQHRRVPKNIKLF